MSSKEYKLPNGKKAVFEYDIFGIGKITLECMDELMGMIADRPHGEWKHDGSVWTYRFNCTNCGYHLLGKQTNYCPYCGARMKGVDDEV